VSVLFYLFWVSLNYKKIFICFFFKKPKAKKRSPTLIDEWEAELSDGDDEVVLDEAILDGQVEEDDEGQIQDDREAVKSIRDWAIHYMKDKHGVSMTREEEKTALGIFPIVRYSSIYIYIY